MKSFCAPLLKQALSSLLVITALLSAAAPISVYSQSTVKPDRQQTLQQPDAVTRWLRQSAIPLRSLTAGNGFEDLQPLKQALRNARIVGLGEATHGTREFFQIKHRLVEFLVRELGFTVFAIEVQYLKCLPINEYVLNGKANDDAAQLVKANLSGIYQTEEVVALLKWMRDYNQSVPPERRVSFRGFDVQTPHLAAAAVAAYLKRVAPDYAPVAQKALNATAPRDFQQFWVAYGKRSAVQKKALHALLLQLLGYLTAHQSRFVRLTSQTEFEEALQAARILVQSDEVRSAHDSQQQAEGDKRDQYMAETVEYLLQRERPETKIILWAHNFHIWTFQPNAGWALDKTARAELKRNELLFKPMGAYLREVFGSEYYAFGLMFDRGAFQAVDDEASDDSMEPLEFALGPSSAGSGGWQMSRAGVGDFIIDLRAAPEEPAIMDWLNSPQSFRYAGASFSSKWTEKKFALPLVLCGQFDGLVFIEKTRRARSLR